MRTLEPGDPKRVGRYKIISKLGSGGMGKVFLARSPGGRLVAVKVIRPELAGNSEFRRRFKREVTAAQRVNGAFTAGVVDADPDGFPPWMATVYVSGLSLSQAIKSHGAWPARSVLVLGASLVEALEVVHAANVIHRDLKPSNVLLAYDGPRIIDFGISVAMEQNAATSTVIGTPGYMSPEQIMGRAVGPASDVFALGAVLAFAATGVGPFGTGNPNALYYRTVHEQPRLDEIPTELIDLVAACLIKIPDDRPLLHTLLDGLTRALGTGGDGQPITPTLLLEQPSWMPDQIAQLIQHHSAAPTRQETVSAPRSSRPRLTPPGQKRWSYGAYRTGRLGAWWDDLADGDAGLTVANSVAYLGGHDKKFYALDVETGQQRWSYMTGHHVSCFPAVAAGFVYFGSYDRKVYALDAETGQQRWVYRTGHWVPSSPAVADGVVYVGSHDRRLYALDAGTGRLRWSYTAGKRVDSSPAVANGVVYFGSFDRKLYAVEAKSGRLRWDFTTGGYVETPIVADGVVYFGSWDDMVYALDAETGQRRWSFKTGALIKSTPLVVNGVAYVTSTDRKIYALDAVTGRCRWDFDTGARVHSSPQLADGFVYVASGRKMHALDADTGEHCWDLSLDRAAWSSPIVAGGAIYIATVDDALHVLQL